MYILICNLYLCSIKVLSLSLSLSLSTKNNISNNYIIDKTVHPIFFIIGENIFSHIVAGFESLNIEEDAWKTTNSLDHRQGSQHEGNFLTSQTFRLCGSCNKYMCSIHCRRG